MSGPPARPTRRSATAPTTPSASPPPNVRAKVDRRGRQSRRHAARRASSSACSAARCNSDAIDNSGGVNCSDVEVNIKIALASAMRKGSLTRPARNKLLAEMTDEVGGLVLVQQLPADAGAFGRRASAGLADLPHQARFMAALEARGLLDRAVETLPSPAALAEREARGEPLTRAELGVLLAYAKIVLFSDIVASDVPDDPHFERDLLGYFPDRMAKKYRGRDPRPPAAPRDHRPRRRQRPDQPRRPVLRHAAAGCDRPQRRRRGARLRRGARRLRPAGALRARSTRSTTRSTARCSSTSTRRSAG